MSSETPQAMTPVGVNHLVLNVRDIERAHAFWTEIMGFRHIGQLQPRGERSMKMRFYNGLSGSHHDLALADIADALAPRISNAHFDDTLVDGEMHFDYRLKPGPVTRSNALAIMRAVGLTVSEGS